MALYRTEKEFLHSLKRLNSMCSTHLHWQTGKSEREHNCEFGHTIEPEELYFKKLLDTEGEQKLRLCKPCMEKFTYMSVDCDLHSKEHAEQVYRLKNPPVPKITQKARG